jgi:hypothetical protein
MGNKQARVTRRAAERKAAKELTEKKQEHNLTVNRKPVKTHKKIKLDES